MTQRQCMKTIQKDFILESSGKSKEEVFGNMFAVLRRRVYREVPGVVLHMEPLEVYILDENKQDYTERFLWLFMPRKKSSYTIKAMVVVLIKYIELSNGEG